jgi:hypothetical protein
VKKRKQVGFGGKNFDRNFLFVLVFLKREKKKPQKER